jgi:hypothetical protein
MPVGRTREEIRVSVGYNLPRALYVSSASSNGDTTSLFDNTLRGGDDVHNGKYIILTSGSNDGAVRRVNDYVESSTDITFEPAASNSVASGDTYEMWLPQYPPTRIHDLINQAIMETYGRVYDPVEDISLHGDRFQARYDLPSDFTMVKRVYYRTGWAGDEVHPCDRTFDETTDSDFTQLVQDEDYKHGSNALSITVAAGASANDLLTDSIDSLDMSGHTHLEFWIKSTVTTTAGQLSILLDDTAACASPLETLAVPALTADTWTYARVALANPESDRAIISIGFRYTSDIGACTIILGYVQGVNNDKMTWGEVPRHLWRIDKESRDLVFTKGGVDTVGSSLIRLQGGDDPLLLTSDSSVCEINDQYVIDRSTELSLLSASGGAQTDAEERRRLAGYFGRRADKAWSRFPMLVGVRKAE